MKIQTHGPIDKDTLMAHLGASLQGYKVYPRQSFLVVEKTGLVGANVVVRKNKVIVVASFPNMGLQIGFMLAVLFLGILIPLLLYFVLLYGKQKAVEKEVGAIVTAFVSGAAAAHGAMGQHGYPGAQPVPGAPAM